VFGVSVSFTLPENPPTREDGRCARPGCRKIKQARQSKTSGQNALTKTPELAEKRRKERLSFVKIIEIEAARDPFCSAECCRKYHKVNYSGSMNSWVDPKAPAPGRKARACKGCGGPMNERTKGCRPCYSRWYARGGRPEKLAPSPA
jgi:hypothetical protein